MTEAQIAPATPATPARETSWFTIDGSGARDVASRVGRKAGEARDYSVRQIRSHPIAATGVGVAAGAVVGALITGAAMAFASRRRSCS